MQSKMNPNTTSFKPPPNPPDTVKHFTLWHEGGYDIHNLILPRRTQLFSLLLAGMEDKEMIKVSQN